MTDKILIFGALGRMGGSIIKALPADTPIRAADISVDGNYPDNVEPFLFDFNHPPVDLLPLFEDVSRMFLLWPPGVDVKEFDGPFDHRRRRSWRGKSGIPFYIRG